MLSRDERLKLDILSIKAYGVSTRWQKIWKRGLVYCNSYQSSQAKGGWRAGAQKNFVPVYQTVYYSISTIRKIMENRVKLLEQMSAKVS